MLLEHALEAAGAAMPLRSPRPREPGEKTMTTARRVLGMARKGELWPAIRWRLRTWRETARERHLRQQLGLNTSLPEASPAVVASGDFARSAETARLIAAFEAACGGHGRLTPEIRAIEGMSGQSYRTFINEYVGKTPQARYLEVGSWAGSTATAALFGNRVDSVCIDNWSLFGGPREAFLANIKLALSEQVAFRFIESDFRAVDFASLGKFNVYLFDGPHEEVDQYDGVKLAQPALEARYLLVVDDWNWRAVRNGTFQALVDLGCRIEAAMEVRTTRNDTHPDVAWEKSEWHNGYFLGVVAKAEAG